MFYQMNLLDSLNATSSPESESGLTPSDGRDGLMMHAVRRRCRDAGRFRFAGRAVPPRRRTGRRRHSGVDRAATAGDGAGMGGSVFVLSCATALIASITPKLNQ